MKGSARAQANGKQSHAVTPPPIKEKESDTAGPPITRRIPDWQDKPPPVMHFPQSSAGQPCH
jgi:hypothetical protein